jgi:hypothetical protein
MRSLPLRSLALDGGHRPRSVRHLPHGTWREADCESGMVRQLPRRSRHDHARHGPRRLRRLPHHGEPRPQGAARRMRELPPRRGDLRAAWPPGVRKLPQTSCAASGDTELRDLPHREGADPAWSRARLRDLPSPARPPRSCQPSELRELPCDAELAGPASRGEPSDLRDLPRAARSCAAQRPRHLRVLSSRPAGPRTDRRQLRELPSVPQVTPERAITAMPQRSRHVARQRNHCGVDRQVPSSRSSRVSVSSSTFTKPLITGG